MRVRGPSTPGRKTLAAVAIAALALAGCSDSGGDGGTGPLPDDAAPADVVAAGLGARLENGAAFTVSVEGDLGQVAEGGETAPPQLQSLLTDGGISGAASPEGGFALTIGTDGGFFEFRAIDEALYLRVDLARLTELLPPDAQVPSADVLRSQAQALGLPPDVQALIDAALAGEWIGITGLSREALQSFAESMGAPVPDSEQASESQQAIKDVLEQHDLLDGQAFTDTYLQVSGEGPTYDVALNARALLTTLNEVATELESALGPAAGSIPSGDLPSTEDVPETIPGFTVTVEDGKATAISADVSAIAEAAGEEAPGDVVVTIELSDIGDQLSVPDATTIAFEDLVSSVMGGLMGGVPTG